VPCELVGFAVPQMSNPVNGNYLLYNNLFINDGSYGMLFDAAHLGFIFPVSIVSRETKSGNELAYTDPRSQI